MNKVAYCRLFGRELGSRAFANQRGEKLEKQADNASEQEVAQVNSLINDLQFREMKEKLAFNDGAYEMLSEFEEAIEKGASANEIKSKVQEAKKELEKQAMAPTNEEENEQMFDAMVKGAAEQTAMLAGQNEVTEDTLSAARDLVAKELNIDSQ